MVNSRFDSLRVVVSCSTMVQAPAGCALGKMPFIASGFSVKVPALLDKGRLGVSDQVLLQTRLLFRVGR